MFRDANKFRRYALCIVLRVVGFRWHKYGIRIAYTGYLNRMCRIIYLFLQGIYMRKRFLSFFFFFYIKNNFSAAQAGNSHEPIHPMCPSEIFFLLLKDVEFSHEIFVWNENGGKKWCLKILLRIIPIEIYYEELLSRWIFKNDR